jgi:hypothetical protein
VNPLKDKVLVLGGILDGKMVDAPPNGENTFTARPKTGEAAVEYRRVGLSDPLYPEVVYDLLIPDDVPDDQVAAYSVSAILRNVFNINHPHQAGTLARFGVLRREVGGVLELTASIGWFELDANGRIGRQPVDVEAVKKIVPGGLEKELTKEVADEALTELFVKLKKDILGQFK